MSLFCFDFLKNIEAISDGYKSVGATYYLAVGVSRLFENFKRVEKHLVNHEIPRYRPLDKHLNGVFQLSRRVSSDGVLHSCSTTLLKCQ